MKKVLFSFFAGLLLFGLANSADAATIQTVIDGRSAPWVIELNSAFPFGTSSNINLPPTVINSSLGLEFKPGNLLSIKYLSGLANAGGGGLWYDGEGVDGWMAEGYPTDPAYFAAPSPVLSQLMVFMGTFANNGQIVGQPFKIGNGPFETTIPFGSNELLLGFNDGWYNDNGGSINVEITETPVPEPSTMVLGILGLAGALRLRRRNK